MAELLPGCPAREVLMTCVSELCANAITHTASGQGGAFTVEVELPRDGVARIAVTDDGGPAFPVARSLDLMAEGGRGLALVAACTSRWGYVEDGPGLTVWAESCWPVAVPAPRDREAADSSRRPRVPRPGFSRPVPPSPDDDWPAGPAACRPRPSRLGSAPCTSHDQSLWKSGWPSCHQISTTLPTMLAPVMGPQNRLSHESARLSPST